MDKVFEASLCETYVKTYVFMWNGALREEFNFYFSGVFASIGGGGGGGGGGGAFAGGGGGGGGGGVVIFRGDWAPAYNLWSFEGSLIFPNFLRS